MSTVPNEQVERVLKVAKSGFFEAIDYLACIAILEAGNDEKIDAAAGKAGAGESAALIHKALFHRLVVSVMAAYDPVRSGDYHLRFGMELLADKSTFDAIVQKGGVIEILQAAQQKWTECLADNAMDRLRHYRNKVAVHLSDPIPGKGDALIGELLGLARSTATVAEKLANGTGIVALSLDSQIDPHLKSAEAFWAHWRA